MIGLRLPAVSLSQNDGQDKKKTKKKQKNTHTHGRSFQLAAEVETWAHGTITKIDGYDTYDKKINQAPSGTDDNNTLVSIERRGTQFQLALAVFNSSGQGSK